MNLQTTKPTKWHKPQIMTDSLLTYLKKMAVERVWVLLNHSYISYFWYF